jgi:hypothetical protein
MNSTFIQKLRRQFWKGLGVVVMETPISAPNSPDLNPLDYCVWTELAGAVKWDKVSSKRTLIEQIKLAVKKVRLEVVFESCNSWTSRLLKVSNNNGDYIP